MSPCAVRYKGEERTYVPEEIICLVLKHLVATAEKQLMGRRITQASVRCFSMAAGLTFAPLSALTRHVHAATGECQALSSVTLVSPQAHFNSALSQKSISLRRRLWSPCRPASRWRRGRRCRWPPRGLASG